MRVEITLSRIIKVTRHLNVKLTVNMSFMIRANDKAQDFSALAVGLQEPR